jgi:hypothetical protein
MKCDTCADLRRKVADLTEEVGELHCDNAELTDELAKLTSADVAVDLRAFVRECAEFACDPEAHKFASMCRACKAKELL